MSKLDSMDCICCGQVDDRTQRGHLWCWECYGDAEALFQFNATCLPADDEARFH